MVADREPLGAPEEEQRSAAVFCLPGLTNSPRGPSQGKF